MLTLEQLKQTYGGFLAKEVANLEDGETRIFYPSIFQQIQVKASVTPEGRLYTVKSCGVISEAMEMFA